MNQTKRLLWLQFILFLIIIPITSPQAQPTPDGQDQEETVLVGHISHVEGELLLYVPDQKEWVATVKDAPFFIDDLLHSGAKARAEFIMPNNTWARIDSDTQIQLNVLKENVTEIHVASGLVRFYNKGSYAVIKATTPFGYVMAPEEASFDLYVGDDSIEVIALKGRLDFFHGTSETRFEVIPGESAILADGRQVTAGQGDVDPGWDRWNRDRENLWATRGRTGGESVKYLPPRLHYEAYALEEYGRWENVYYDGAYRYFWRPVYVSVGWTPFTVGGWTVCYGEHIWIPCEPFGYVTHHYGNWVFIRGFWYWAPPVVYARVRVGPPLLNIGFAWYPGRVAWIHSGGYIGWVPLAPYEPYYCYRRWGPRVVVVKKVNITNLNINRYKYVKHAVIINKTNLYSVKDYTKARMRHIDHASVVHNYRVAPVLDHTVINNHKNMRQRYHFTNFHLTRKSNRPAIKTNPSLHLNPRQGADGIRKTVRPNIADAKPERPTGRESVRSPRTKDRSAPAHQLNRRVSQAEFHDREPKKKAGQGIEEQIETTTERRQEVRMPIKSVVRQKVRVQDQGHTGKEVQRRSSPQPVRQQEVQAEERNRTEGKKQRYTGESRLDLQNRSRSHAEGGDSGKDRIGERQSKIRDFSGRKQNGRKPFFMQRAVR